MRTTKTYALSFFLGAGLFACAVQAREPIPIDSFARVPQLQSVSMSSDGNNIVALIASPGSEHKETALATWKVDDLAAGPIVTPSGDSMKFIAANAMKAGRVLVSARQEWTGRLAGCGEGNSVGGTRTFVVKTYLTDAATQKNFKEAFADNVRRTGISKETQRCLEIAGTAGLANRLPLDPDNVIISQLNSATLSSNYYLYNLRTDETKLLFRGSSKSSPGLFDGRTGEVLTRVEIEPVSSTEYEQRISIRNPETGAFEVHDPLTSKLTDRHTFDIVGIEEKTGKFYVLTDMSTDRVEAWVYDPATRKFDTEPLLAHPEFSISGLILGSHENDFNQVLGFTFDGVRREQVFVEDGMRALHDGIKQAFPGQSVTVLDYNTDRSRVLFSTQSAQRSPAYHLLEDRKKVVTLGSQRPWIDPALIGEQRWINYKARDGQVIPALLDLPAGWSAAQGPLPAVVHPHGGPWARDYGGWDVSGWVPFLTSRGYAVIRPQYRGSAGLGRKLWLAGDAQWGLAMQDDNDDAAAWLVSQGIADPERIAIFGYSYGGFAAAAASVRKNGPFQCAIAGAPVTDLGRLGVSWSENRLQRLLQGRTVRGMDPMRNTANADIPILLYVGDRDVRTPKFHAESFYKAVKKHVPAELEIIPDMPHSLPWFYRHHETTLGLIERYLADNCGPNGL